MPTCAQCGKQFTPGAAGWMGRIEGPATGILPGSPLNTILMCPEDFANLPPTQKGRWHEHFDPPPGGPTREKRPGHLRA